MQRSVHRAVLVVLCAAFLLCGALPLGQAAAPAYSRAPVEGLFITSPGNGTHWNATSINVQWRVVGTIVGNYSFLVKVDDGDWFSNGHRTSLTLTSLEEGWHRVEVMAVPEAGPASGDLVEFEVDTLAPSIVFWSPTGAQVPLRTELMVTFSEDMDRDSVRVAGVEGALVWSGRGFVLSPFEPFAAASNYTVAVSGLDLAGNQLAGGTWQFSTTDRGSITGKVKDDLNRTVPGALVRVLSDGEVVASAETDSQGYFSVQVAQGRYNLSVSGPGIEARELSVNVTAGQTLELGVVQVTSVPDDTWLVVIGVAAAGAIALFLIGRRRQSLGER